MSQYRVAVILVSVILVIDGNMWYSATIIEDQTNTDQKKLEIFRTDYIQDGEHRYMPHTVTKYANISNDARQMQKGNDTILDTNLNATTVLYNLNEQEENLYNLSTTPTLEKPQVFRKKPLITYNNIINNRNLYKTTRPKRKIVRKRCPAFVPRQKKQMVSDEKAKTRFLEIFQVVEFDHVACTSSSGLEGTCLYETDCTSSGGLLMGTCADGYGSCCVIQYSCDDTSSAAVGWFTNPGFPDPSTDRLSCPVTINKASEDVKQIRLDFLNFELLPPTAGTCEQDQFVISGQNANSIVPILCGVNTGQHIYIEVGDVDGPVNLSIQTASAESRLFAIKVSQLTADHDLAAPTGCLQYFQGGNGYLESFNYRDASDTAIPKAPSYLNNLNYAMCIARATASCSITYTNAGIMQIINYDSDGLPVIPPGQAGVEIFNCPSDWLLMSAARLCGDRLNDGSVLQDFSLDAPITDVGAGPIVVWFRSDEGYVGRGFKLQYQQNSCSS